jgi:cell division protein FtsB
MKKINFRRLYYHVRHKYFTLNSVVVLAAFVIAASWVWGSLGVMQRNYDLQKQLDLKQRQLQLTQIQTSSLQLEQRYYQTAEYQELAARADLGLVKPGEKLLILPPNSAAVKAADAATTIQTIADLPQQSNVQQWVNFLFGGDVKPTSSNS